MSREKWLAIGWFYSIRDEKKEETKKKAIKCQMIPVCIMGQYYSYCEE